jgi:hypothetical protein
VTLEKLRRNRSRYVKCRPPAQSPPR